MLVDMISEYYLTDFNLWKLVMGSAKDRIYTSVIEKIGNLFELNFTSAFISRLDEKNKKYCH